MVSRVAERVRKVLRTETSCPSTSSAASALASGPIAAALRWEDVMEVMVDSLKRTFEHNRIVICGYNPHSGRGYLWKIHGRSITGATAATLTIPNIGVPGAGDYGVTVNNASGPVGAILPSRSRR